jgi:tRNA pseudouridine32 synthase / 23S rRNA pseudouridine746 synthase
MIGPSHARVHAQPIMLPIIAHIFAGTRSYVVIDKPSGLLSVPGIGPSNQHAVQTMVRSQFPEAEGPLTVHRLDQHTSGLMLIALDQDTHRQLSSRFERREVQKTYIALTGPVAQSVPSSGTISLALRPDITRRPKQLIDPVLGKPAVTTFQILHTGVDHARWQLVPTTGRTHQLRVHLAAIGYPILHDTLYGSAPLTQECTNERATGPHLRLHAQGLSFACPLTGETKVFQSEPTW